MACSIGIGMAIGGLSVWAAGGNTQDILVGVALGGLVGSVGGMIILSGGLTWGTFVAGFSLKSLVVTSSLSILGLSSASYIAYNETVLGEKPTIHQQSRINEAISYIESISGYEKIAANLKKMQFRVGDYNVTANGWARQPQVSWSTIIMQQSMLEPTSFADIVFVASTIIHEYTHSYTLPLFKSSFRGEMWAWSAQSEFLKDAGVYGRYKDIQTKYPDTYQDFIEELAIEFKKRRVVDPAVW